MQAKLVVVGGRANKKEVDVRLPFAIGRSDAANLTIEHRAISRQHCELLERNGHLVVRDVGSANGTYIGERQITGETVLEPGDTFTVGPLTFRAVYEVAKAPVEPVAEMPAAGTKLLEEDVAAATDHLALPDEGLELDSFDLELSDDIDLPEIARGDLLEPAPRAAEAEAEEAGDLELGLPDLDKPHDELSLDAEIAEDALSLPLDVDEPLATDVPEDLADTLELDLAVAETVQSSVKSDESLELDLDLGDELPSEANFAAAAVEEDDSPTEIGEYVDLRGEEETPSPDVSSAVPAEHHELSDVPDDLLAELDSQEQATGTQDLAAAPAEPDSEPAARQPADEAVVRDFSDASHVDDAPSQELFLVDGEEAFALTASSEIGNDAETPWVDLEDELAAPPGESAAKTALEPATDALDDDLALAAPIAESESAEIEALGERAPEIELPEFSASDEDELALELPVEEVHSSDALAMEEPPAEQIVEEEAVDPIATGSPAAEELSIDIEDDLSVTELPAAAEEPGATSEPDFTAWMFEDSLTAPETPADNSASLEADMPALDESRDELRDSLALENELPPLDLAADDLPPLEMDAADEELSFEPIAKTDAPLTTEAVVSDELAPAELEFPADSASEESSLDGFELEDSVEESAEIEFAEFNPKDSAAGEEEVLTFDDQPVARDEGAEFDLPAVEATGEPSFEEMDSFDELSFDDAEATGTEAEPELIAEAPAELLEEPLDSGDASFDDWVAAEMTSRPTTPVDEPVSLDEPSLGSLEEEPARFSAESADELNFDDVPPFDADSKVEEEFQLDDELSFDEIDTPQTGREKVELPAVFEESASLDLDVESDTAAAPIELPPTEPPKAKRSWWPFGRKREPKPPKPPKAPKPLKGKKKANQTLDAAASLPLDEVSLDEPSVEPVAMPEEIEFSLDDTAEFTADGPAFDAPLVAAADFTDPPPSAPPGFAPADPLDELNFPLDDTGASLSPAELTFDEPKFDELTFEEPAMDEAQIESAELEVLSFDEPVVPAEPFAMETIAEEPVIESPAPAMPEETAEIEFAVEEPTSAESESFSLDDDEPAISFNEAEPEIAFNEIEAIGAAPSEVPLEFDDLESPTPLSQPVFEDLLPAMPSAPADLEPPAPAAAEPTEKPRRRWWPFGGKKKDTSATAPPAEPKRSRADKTKSRGTIVPDDLSAADFTAEGSLVEESDSERISRRLSGAPLPVEKYPSFEDDAVGPADTASRPSPQVATSADTNTPSFEMDEAPAFSLDEDEAVPSFDLEEELPEFVDDSDATTTANKARSVGNEAAPNNPESWADRPARDEPRAQRRSTQDPEDDWDSFLKSFDS